MLCHVGPTSRGGATNLRRVSVNSSSMVDVEGTLIILKHRRHVIKNAECKHGTMNKNAIKIPIQNIDVKKKVILPEQLPGVVSSALKIVNVRRFLCYLADCA